MIRRESTEDIPAIMEMASVVFPETYRDIISSEQIKSMMDMMYSKISLKHQMNTTNNIFFISDGKGFVSFRYKKGFYMNDYIMSIDC